MEVRSPELDHYDVWALFRLDAEGIHGGLEEVEQAVGACMQAELKSDRVELRQPRDGVEGGAWCGPSQPRRVKKPRGRCLIPGDFASPVVQPACSGIGVRSGHCAKYQGIVRKVEDLCAHSSAHSLSVGWADGSPSTMGEPSRGVAGEGEAVCMAGVRADAAIKSVV